MSKNSILEDGEIDLRELIAALWSHKLLIAIITALSIFIAVYYALTADKKFTAISIFQIEENNSNSRFNIGGELGALASLAGISTGGKTSTSKALLERAIGREFILKMAEKPSSKQLTKQ